MLWEPHAMLWEPHVMLWEPHAMLWEPHAMLWEPHAMLREPHAVLWEPHAMFSLLYVRQKMQTRYTHLYINSDQVAVTYDDHVKVTTNVI